MAAMNEIEREILNDSKIVSKRRDVGRRPRRKVKVSRLKENRPVSELDILVLRRYPPRLVSSRKWTGRVAAACGRDESGVVGLVLWDEQIDEVATGDWAIYQVAEKTIQNGWCKRRLGERVVSTGRSGKLSVIG